MLSQMEINVETGETVEIEMTKAEATALATTSDAAAAAAAAETAAAEAKKAAILAALADATGFTPDELREALNA